ncbi:MAG: hypothetical protein RL154_1172, partial [Pseudomonadota bacterium]
MIHDYEETIKKKDKKLEILENLKRFDTYKKDTISNRLDLISYKEILKFGTRQDKINLIGLLSYTPNKNHVALIAKALSDDDETVRILASTATQKMDDFFHLQINSLTKSLKEIEPTYILYLDLAKTYDDYIYSGLIPKESLAHYQDKMLFYYDLAYNFADNKNKVAYNYLRALIRAKKLQEAKQVLESYGAYSKDEVSYKFWQAEIEFLSANFSATSGILNSLDSELVKNERL